MFAAAAGESDDPVRPALFAIVVLACGESASVTPDAGQPMPIDMPPDPFVGMFDDASDLPHMNCTPGSLAGFARPGHWPELAMRTETFTGLRVYVMDGTSERLVEHVLTDDDLFVRATTWNGEQWQLRAIAVCGSDADGTLHGAEVTCNDGPIACAPTTFAASQLHRIAGEAEGEHLVKLGEFRGDWSHGKTVSVRVFQDTAFVAQGEGGLRIVSIVDPAAPRELAQFGGGLRRIDDLELVRGVDGRRYLVTAGSLPQVVDVDDPTNPQRVSELAIAARTVFVDGTTAYFVGADSPDVHVYDVSQPRRPKRVSTYEPSTTARWHDVFAANGVAYLSDAGGSGIHVVDFNDLANPRELAVEPGGIAAHTPWLTAASGRPLVLAATEGFGSRLRILDGNLGTAAFLSPLGAWSLRHLVSMRDLRAIGDRIYLAHHRDGVRVVGLGDPSAPAMVGYYNTWIEGTGSASPFEGVMGIDIDRPRNRVYLADSIRGLVILQGDSTIFP